MTNNVSILVCHQGEIIAHDFKKFPQIETCNLNAALLSPPYEALGSRLAEMRAFPRALELNANFVGLVSWRMGAKRGDNLSWSRLIKKAETLKVGQAMAPYLWRSPKDDLRDMAERSFPGMGLLVDRLRQENPPRTSNAWHVAGNSFIIDREELNALVDFTRSYLVWDLWGSQDPAFGFRCNSCDNVSNTGIGRYTRQRDVALFGEVATMYYFQSLSKLKFVGIDQSLKARTLGRIGRALKS